jgi:thiamine-monophosphate kinase
MRLDELGEFGALARLIRDAGALRDDVILGPGDDAAVMRFTGGEDLVVTTDAFIEGRHWREGWLAPAELGRRLVAANVSDLAAMAAEPRWALIQYGMPRACDIAELEAIQSGVARALEAEGATLVGGNLSSVEGARWLSLTLLGACSPGLVWKRSGARPGDLVGVTGSPGRAGATVRLLERLGVDECASRFSLLLDGFRAPESRVAFARALAAADGVSAAVDLSDGLAADLGHLCDASQCGVELDLRSLAPDARLEAAAAFLGIRADELQISASDDYELVLAVSPGSADACASLAARHGVPFAIVGRITEKSAGRVLVDANDARDWPAGFDHFAR